MSISQDGKIQALRADAICFGDLNSIDLLVEGWDTEPPKAVSYLLLIGGKAGLATPGEVEEVEQRALAACKEHSHRRTLWAMTYFGPNARLWAYTSEIESLVSFFPETEDGNARIQDAVVKTSTYLDFAEHESHFINSFHHIEQNPDPSPARFLRAKEQVPSQAMIENRPKDSGDAI
ncbi:hypothetical protein QQX98_000853 [Neonectria punicea]|uniref:Uncharacterized protein n=1 Tax=Neonectria punicea TaxID=979145 RepID=A0ABR1HSG9_9HYPO